jgi:hypothetical protein
LQLLDQGDIRHVRALVQLIELREPETVPGLGDAPYLGILE